jgi:hypothetical protein
MSSQLKSLWKKFIDPDKYGIISIDYILSSVSVETLIEFAKQYDISVIVKGPSVKNALIEVLIKFFLEDPVRIKEAKSRHIDPLVNFGEHILESGLFTPALQQFDLMTKAELMNVFADFCADLKINVYKARGVPSQDCDLFLTKKDPLLKTETAFLLTAKEIETTYNDDLFETMNQLKEVSDWRIFVTTALGAAKIGYEKLLIDMKRFDCWCYIVDPLQKRILGLSKGGKSDIKSEIIRDKYIRQLPAQPFRAPSQVIKISKYDWSEKDAYNPKKILPYYFSEEGFADIEEAVRINTEIFQTLLIMDKDSGLSLYSYSNKENQVDGLMLSGFFTALESFVKGMSADASLREIDYQEFKINAVTGKYVKIILLTSASIDDVLWERLQNLLEYFEKRFGEQIHLFTQTGDQDLFNKAEITEQIQKILLI